MPLMERIYTNLQQHRYTNMRARYQEQKWTITVAILGKQN